jgi:hypothetical protein
MHVIPLAKATSGVQVTGFGTRRAAFTENERRNSRAVDYVVRVRRIGRFMKYHTRVVNEILQLEV